MRTKLFTSSIMLAFILLASSCASIIHGSKQDVSISSSPTAATVSIDNQKIGQTPITTKLSRKDHHTVRIELPGYMPYETKFTRKVDAWIAGNIIFGGIPGLAIDAITGGMYKLTPSEIQAEMKNDATTIKEIKNEMYFTVVLQPNPSWEKIGQLERK